MSSPIQPHAIEVQGRDLKVFRGLFESRIMTVEHMAAMYFGGSYEAARKRMQKLKGAGYVGERPRRAYDPAVLFLTKKAFALLCERGAIADFPHMTWKSLEKRVRVSPLTINHELEVQDVKAAVVKAVSETPSLEIMGFNTWPMMCQFRAYTPAGAMVTVKPDGMLRIRQMLADRQPIDHTFYLEIDRSTETLDTLLQRACCYRDFYRRGGLAVRNGQVAQAFEQFPFRVLMIFKSLARLDSVAEKLLACRPPILTQIWMTTFSEIIKSPLGAIWTRPVDCREALRQMAPIPIIA